MIQAFMPIKKADAAKCAVRGIIAGLASGIGLGMLLKVLQALTNERVYTLLLNIDFVPFMPTRLPEIMEFALHLAVSLPLGIVYLLAAERSGRPVMTGIAFGLVIAVLTWIPLTLLSDRVPSIDDGRALLLWLAAHICYGLLLSIFARRERLDESGYKAGG
ncbi:hypothetical protein PAECIP111893_03928 [Paenibacillus plantiphilus]|uniref:DUF1440 domain-containing protein n=1 Tax=Paenibacillus plantiphilus TaxID=2905650 RepID=A0ABM9CK98_9BACL|nr:hypothetical protein [Paenibacillus plantiphilus]CAH1215337.1 hypothetical protein PAECIP111893_03928 [Paenibacillus plantiphilus]